MKKVKESENFLDLIAKRNEKYSWIELESDIVQIHIHRNTRLDKVVRKFFRTPEVMKIDLDKYGSFLWKEIDGTSDVGSIANKFSENFGDEVEPLYERLIHYVNILKNNEFISIS
jgi:hypothetical protein